MPLRLDHDITALKGADYNPRAISDDDFAALVESVRELGVVKPIIARDETIVAGHQRTRALRALGIGRAPVYLLEADATAYDEVRFNQLHNGTDLDGEARAPETRTEDLGWRHFAPGSIVADGRQRYAPIRYSIASLIATYGPWGACVATQSGEIIHCAQYAIACSQVGQPVLAYVVPDADRDRYKARLSRGYGVYSYDHIERRTYVQSYAQPFRLRGNQQYQLKSDLYEKEVIPRLKGRYKATVTQDTEIDLEGGALYVGEWEAGLTLQYLDAAGAWQDYSQQSPGGRVPRAVKRHRARRAHFGRGDFAQEGAGAVGGQIRALGG